MITQDKSLKLFGAHIKYLVLQARVGKEYLSEMYNPDVLLITNSTDVKLQGKLVEVNPDMRRQFAWAVDEFVEGNGVDWFDDFYLVYAHDRPALVRRTDEREFVVLLPWFRGKPSWHVVKLFEGWRYYVPVEKKKRTAKKILQYLK